jgi:hypothetical protein
MHFVHRKSPWLRHGFGDLCGGGLGLCDDARRSSIEVGDRAKGGLNPRITIPVTDIHRKWRSLRSASTVAMFAIVEMSGFPVSYR